MFETFMTRRFQLAATALVAVPAAVFLAVQFGLPWYVALPAAFDTAIVGFCGAVVLEHPPRRTVVRLTLAAIGTLVLVPFTHSALLYVLLVSLWALVAATWAAPRPQKVAA